MRIALGLALALLGPLAGRAAAHPTIAPGDVAIVAAYADSSHGPVGFAFVPLVDFHPVEVVAFTDRGWRADGRFRAGEGFAYWDVERSVTAGTVFERSLSLDAGGDSIVAFVGALDPDGAPTDSLLFGLRLGGAWDADATSDETSALPPALAGLEVALAGTDCAYTGPTEGTRSALRGLIADPARWTCSDTARPAAPTAFTVFGDLGDGCGTDADCGPGVPCAWGVCCESECGRDEVGHCARCYAETGECGPASEFQSCRLSAGPCDVLDKCDGVSLECPADARREAGYACRAAVDACDAPETCDGVAAECPIDAAVDCDDGDRCTADACDAIEGCAHAPIAGCCAGGCDDAGASPVDAGAVSMDGGVVGEDAGERTDAGREGAAPGGCGVGGRGAGSRGAWWWGAVGLVLWARARARARASRACRPAR